jgi:pimeloyl-ACP methyl ester carboxylesterase
LVAREVDHAFRRAALTRRPIFRRRSTAESLGHDERITGLGAMAEIYARPDLVADPGTFFAQSTAIAPVIKRVRGYGKRGEVLDLTWQSDYQPLWGQPGFMPDVAVTGIDTGRSVRAKYLAEERNLVGHARWFRHLDGVRPAVMILHGYLAGELNVEEQVWPTRALFKQGYDVIFTVLPFHGARKTRLLAPPRFPASDPRFTIEGFRHLVFDHVALTDYMLRGRVKSMGLMGMSLGGYGASLLATVDPRWSFVVPVVPLSCTAQFALETGRFVGTPEQQALQQQALSNAQRAISPLERPALIDSDRIVIVAGASDHVTGLPHAQRLATHFNSDLITFDGGHLLQFGIGNAMLAALEKVTR